MINECKVIEALSLNEGQRMNLDPGEIKFWSPVRNYPDAYVHFTIPVDPVE
jgi:hypothetical protein